MNVDPDEAPPASRHRDARANRMHPGWPLLAALVAAGLAGLWYWNHEREARLAAPVPGPAATAPQAPAPEAPGAPPIAHPVPPPADPSKPLPALADSDAAVRSVLVELFGSEAVGRLFVGEDAIRRFVATVDNLPRKTVAARLMPVKPVPGGFVTSGADDATTIDARNAYRYRPYVLAMEGVPAKRLVAAYAYLYPLFQAAYRDLGYPNGYFNDRLVAAIDDMLAAPEVTAPRVTQPKVLYEFADPALEGLSAGQKILVRMGPDNAKRVKEKLRAIRSELTGERAP
ncbi:MAG: DUF3014 domain-containing protein [Burkholderiales bacterium]